MLAHIGDRLQPVHQVGLEVVPVIEDLTGEGVVLDVLDPGLDLALALGVVALAGVDAEPGGSGIGGKALVEVQLAILLVQHHQFGLVVDALLGTAAEVAEGGIVQADEGGGVDGMIGNTDIHQPGIGQDEHHEVNGGLDCADPYPAKLAAIDLTLHPGHALDRLVVAPLAQRHRLLEVPDVTPRGPVGHRQRRVLLLELAQDLYSAEVGELTK